MYTPALADPLGRPVPKALCPGHHQVFPPSEQIHLHADGIVEDHRLAVVPGEFLPLILIGGGVAAAREIGPHLLDSRENLIGDVRAVETAGRPGTYPSS